MPNAYGDIAREYTAAGYDAGMPSPTRNTQVSQQLILLDQNLEVLEKAIYALEEKMKPVLGSDLPSKNGVEERAQTPLVPLAEQMNAIVIHLHRLIGRVESMSQRVEL